MNWRIFQFFPSRLNNKKMMIRYRQSKKNIRETTEMDKAVRKAPFSPLVHMQEGSLDIISITSERKINVHLPILRI